MTPMQDKTESRIVRVLFLCALTFIVFSFACFAGTGCKGDAGYQSDPLSESAGFEASGSMEEPSDRSVPENRDADHSIWTVSPLALERFMEPMEQNSWERPADCPVSFVMLHFSSDVVRHPEHPFDLDEMVRVFADSGASVHYVIDREGTVWCFVPEDRVAWHAGKGTWKDDPSYTDRMSFYSIGIELLAIGSERDMEKYLSKEQYAEIAREHIGFTDKQYESLRELLTDLCGRYGLPMDREHVIGHEEYAAGRKRDPGELFDWELVLN